MLIAGDFTSQDDTARNRVARLNVDGSLDTSSNPGAGTDGTVCSLLLQPDGKAPVGGTFATYKGRARSRIARIDADGGLDASFNPGSGGMLL